MSKFDVKYHKYLAISVGVMSAHIHIDIDIMSRIGDG